MARDLCNFLQGLKPAMGMVLAQTIFAGINVFYKLAYMDGMDMRILVAYRYIFAIIFLAPIAFIVERNKRPNLTWKVTFLAFLCGLFGGTLSQNLYIASLTLTSMTFVAAMSNLTSAITYIMAVTFRLERMGIQTLAGKAKLMGTAIGIGGAMVLTFYKGAKINIWSTKVDLTRWFGSGSSTSALHMKSENPVLGSLLALCNCFSYALWLIIQTKMSESYPCYLSSTTLIAITGSIQSFIYALCVQRKWEEWKLGWNIRLWTVAYGGIMGNGVWVTLVAWVVRARGPVFVSVFSPLVLVLVAIIGSLLVDEKLHVGSRGSIDSGRVVCGTLGKGERVEEDVSAYVIREL
ncbi:WAT1-related protein At1g25270-like isoform X2 [Macadamia integrifolia]|uniref:WAT1-related protein At1g25270-like isoform X2 n=1 Tax=Macadamia integrifolia TaxID=60698 RepID=UPI001C4E9C93|nr:WAT1-related protein At1g25270-like isoform X2 [Macadamia integrifolia]